MTSYTPPGYHRTKTDQEGRKWNTSPERKFNEYQRARGLGLVQNVVVKLPVWDGAKAGLTQEFQLDFARPGDYQRYAVTGFHDSKVVFDLNVEIDGEGHARGLDSWKDKVKNSNGMKVIHVLGRLCDPAQWHRLDHDLSPALVSERMVIYIPSFEGSA